MPYRPMKSTGNGTGYLGFQNCQILGFKDRSDEPQLSSWADLFLEVELKTETSQYPSVLVVKGQFEKDTNGNIKDCSLLNKIYYLMDAIQCDAGPNTKGEWEDANGNPIEELDTFLNEHYVDMNTVTMPYHVYMYKEKSKSNGKVYTTVCPKIVKATPKEIKELKDYIKYMMSKGYIPKELEPVVSSDEDDDGLPDF